jgi:DNA-binding MarR family transcriptional regulator
MQDRDELLETTRCLCLASRRAARTITRTFDRALRGYGLHAPQFTLLSALQLKGPQSINALADLLGAERSTVSRNLSVVAQNGLARLDADPHDARARIAGITAKGLRTLRETLPVWREVQAALVEDIGAETAVSLRRLAGGPCTLLDNVSSPTKDKP